MEYPKVEVDVVLRHRPDTEDTEVYIFYSSEEARHAVVDLVRDTVSGLISDEEYLAAESGEEGAFDIMQRLEEFRIGWRVEWQERTIEAATLE